jgi:hypothetical protein
MSTHLEGNAMPKVQKVKLRHPELSKARKTDVEIEVLPGQVAIYKKSGWKVAVAATQPTGSSSSS